MKRNKLGAADLTQQAADQAQEIFDAVAEKVLPLVEQAQEFLAPVAADYRDKAVAVAHDAAARSAAAAHDAKVKGATHALGLLDAAKPAIADTFDKVTPLVESARARVSNDFLPKLADALKAAAELPAEIGHSSTELVGAKSGKKGRKVLGPLALAAALLGGAAYLLRKYLAQTDESGWAAHEPSVAYTAPAEPATDEATADLEASSDVPEATADAETNADAPGATAEVAPSDDQADADQADADLAADEAPVKGEHFYDDQAATDEEPRPFSDAAAVEDDGSEGRHVGDNPPEGFTIKGNQRSMKYHVEGSPSHEKTNADEWFASEEAARAAGYTRSQR